MTFTDPGFGNSLIDNREHKFKTWGLEEKKLALCPRCQFRTFVTYLCQGLDDILPHQRRSQWKNSSSAYRRRFSDTFS